MQLWLHAFHVGCNIHNHTFCMKSMNELIVPQCLCSNQHQVKREHVDMTSAPCQLMQHYLCCRLQYNLCAIGATLLHLVFMMYSSLSSVRSLGLQLPTLKSLLCYQVDRLPLQFAVPYFVSCSSGTVAYLWEEGSGQAAIAFEQMQSEITFLIINPNIYFYAFTRCFYASRFENIYARFIIICVIETMIFAVLM